jgi:hypothetical protein
MLEMHEAIHMSIPGHWSIGFLHDTNKILDGIDYGKYWGYTPPIPFPWEGSIGSNEGNKVEFDYTTDPSLTIKEFFDSNY